MIKYFSLLLIISYSCLAQSYKGIKSFKVYEDDTILTRYVLLDLQGNILFERQSTEYNKRCFLTYYDSIQGKTFYISGDFDGITTYYHDSIGKTIFIFQSFLEGNNLGRSFYDSTSKIKDYKSYLHFIKCKFSEMNFRKLTFHLSTLKNYNSFNRLIYEERVFDDSYKLNSKSYISYNENNNVTKIFELSENDTIGRYLYLYDSYGYIQIHIDSQDTIITTFFKDSSGKILEEICYNRKKNSTVTRIFDYTKEFLTSELIYSNDTLVEKTHFFYNDIGLPLNIITYHYIDYTSDFVFQHSITQKPSSSTKWIYEYY